MNEKPVKVCKGCLMSLPLSRFNKHTQTKDGYRAKCIDCRRLEHIEYRKNNPEKIKEIQRVCDQRKVRTPEAREKKRLRQSAYNKTPEGRLKNSVRYRKWREKRCNSPRKSNLKTAEQRVKHNKRLASWRSRNKDKCNAKYAIRRASKRSATPPWLTDKDKEDILDLYTACRMFKIYTGLEYHVDHIVPLINDVVCGLHIPANLRVIEAKVNMSKNNKFDESLGIDYTASAYC